MIIKNYGKNVDTTFNKEQSMNKKEFIKAVKKADHVFGWIRLFDGDAVYLEIKKGSALIVAKNQDLVTDTEFKAYFRDSDNSLYID